MTISEITVEELAKKLKIPRSIYFAGCARAVRVGASQDNGRPPRSRADEPIGDAKESNAFSESAQSKDAEIYVMCHHGSRSMQVTAWLASQGWTNVHNVSGGIDAFARTIDPTIGIY